MKTRFKISAGIIATALVSTIIAYAIHSILLGMKREVARDSLYDEAMVKANAMNVLLAEMRLDPSPSTSFQVSAVQASLGEMIRKMSSRDAVEQTLIHRIQGDADRLGYLIHQMNAIRPEADREMATERMNIFKIQSWMNVRQISEDIGMLHQMSQKRLRAAQEDAKVATFLLFGTLILSNSIISIVSGNSILRFQSNLQQSEERFRRALENIPDVIVIYDTDRRIRYINSATTAVTGKPIEDYIGKRDEDIWPPEVYESYLPALKEACRRRRMTLIKTELDIPGQSKRHLRIRCVPIVNQKGELLEVIGITHDDTARMEYQEELRKFTSYLQNEIEKERAAIARELHDDLGQTMSALKLDLGWINRRLAAPEQRPVQKKIQEMSAMITDSVQTMKRICSDLRPSILDDMGLQTALEWYVANYTTRRSIQCDLRFDVGPDTVIGNDLSTAVFRITQEALTNASRHSGASRVTISIRGEHNTLTLEIEDDGVGMNTDDRSGPNTSFGIIGMRERVSALSGRFDISSAAGSGTRISAAFPLAGQALPSFGG